jgi:peptidyl-prolyl cis-trans isomerase C
MARTILLSLSCLGLAAQTTLGAQAPPPPTARPPVPVAPPGIRPPMPAKAETIPPERVLGRIGAEVIHEKDFESWLTALAGPRRVEQMSRTPGGLSGPRQQFLDAQVFAAKARKEGLQKLPEFQEQLKIQEDLVLAKLLMNEERPGSDGQRLKERAESPSDEEIRAYFDENAQRYETPEKFTARHILVGLKSSPRMGGQGLTEDEAQARLAKIQEELAAGKKFEDLAREYSDDPGSKNTGGLLKDATYGVFVKEFEEAVRAQEIGKVGAPVKTVFGYHLILVESRTPRQAAVFEQVRERVKQQLILERRQAMYKEFVEQARQEVGFVAEPEPAAKPTVEPGAPGSAKP